MLSPNVSAHGNYTKKKSFADSGIRPIVSGNRESSDLQILDFLSALRCCTFRVRVAAEIVFLAPIHHRARRRFPVYEGAVIVCMACSSLTGRLVFCL